MKTPLWVIEDFDRENSFHSLADEARRQGMDVQFIEDYYKVREDMLRLARPEDAPAPEGPVIVQSSIQLAKLIQRYRPEWASGVWAHWRDFKCSTYYAHWGQWLLNKDYLMMPFAELKRRVPELLETEQFSNGFFLRPDNGSKSFSGMVLYKHDLVDTRGHNTWRYLEANAETEDLVVVAEPKQIAHEWRVICTKDTVVTGSRYKTHGQSDFRAELPEKVEEFALKVITSAKWIPAPIFVIDIAQDSTFNRLHLLEIGSFSVAGLYHCDAQKIVATATKIAVEQYKRDYLENPEVGDL